MMIAALMLAVSAAAFSGRDNQIHVTPPRLDSPAAIDGVLDEAAWSEAALLTGFSQYAPVDGREAENETEVLVFYTPTAIYFGIRAQADPGSVHATLASRDRIDADDVIQIFLNPFNDRRQALVFAVNPLGIQSDGALVEGTNNRGGAAFSALESGREATDLTPDYVYESKGRVTPAGYEIEVAIPFKTLRFPAARVQSWSVNITRRVQSSGQEDSWTPAARAQTSFLAQSGTLRVMVLWGHDENFFEWSSADILFSTYAIDWRPTTQLRISPQYQLQSYKRRTDGSTVGVGRIPRLKVEYQVSRPVFVRFVGEYDTEQQDVLRDDSRTSLPIVIRDPASGEFVASPAVERNRLRIDALFSYQTTPGTVFFAGYSSILTEPRGLRFNRLQRGSDGFYLKASYLFRL